MIDTGTPYRVQPDIKTFFQKGYELLLLGSASDDICIEPDCENEAVVNHGWCGGCWNHRNIQCMLKRENRYLITSKKIKGKWVEMDYS